MKNGLSLLLLFSAWFLSAQNETNTLVANLQKMKADSSKVNQYHKIAKSYASDSAKALFYNRNGLELAQKINWKDGIAKSYLQLGDNYFHFYNYPKARANYDIALSKTSNKKLRAEIYFSIGQIYLEESNFTKALATYHQSLRLFETTKDKPGIIKVLLSIGSLYTGFGKNKEALDTYNHALKISNETQFLKQEIILRGIGTVYYNFGENEKSLDYLERSLTLIRKKNDNNLESRLLSDIALVYLEMGAYQKAIDLSQASLKTDPSIINKIHNTAFSYGVIGDSFLELAKEQKSNKKAIDSAIFYLEKAVKLHKEFNSLRGLHDDFRSISEAHKLNGDQAKALQFYEISVAYKDSIYNSDNKETIKNLEDKRAIELRDKEIKINKLELEAKEKQKWYLVGGLALLAVIGLLLFNQNRNRRKTNEQLQTLNANLDQKNISLDQANKTNARFFSILNHDLRSPVYNLIHYLHLQKDSPELLDAEMKKNIEAKHITSAENLLQSMEDLLLWSKSQMENFSPQFEEFTIDSLFADTKNHFSSFENIPLLFENPQNLSLHTDANYLKTILRNLTGNALKAIQDTQSPTITWKAWRANEQTFLSISDNGFGASNDQLKALYDENEVVGIQSGLGLHLIRDLAKIINCTISVDSKVGLGTTFTLVF